MFLVNTISGIEKSLHHRFLRIRFDPLPSECLAERVKLYAPDKKSPTPLDTIRLRGDLRIFLHVSSASEMLARTVWKWFHEPDDPNEVFTRKTLEDIFWIGMVFNILDLPLVYYITSLSQPGVLHTMPNKLYQHHIKTIRNTILKKLDANLFP